MLLIQTVDHKLKTLQLQLDNKTIKEESFDSFFCLIILLAFSDLFDKMVLLEKTNKEVLLWVTSLS